MHVITGSCVLFVWMYTLTLVKSQDCTREQFLTGRLFDSNFDTTDLEATYPGGKLLRVGCNVGFSGFFRMSCVEGQWQSRDRPCQPRSCGHPGDAQFADFNLDKGDDFVFASQVVYTCHKGYQMVSRTNYRRCMAGGWDGVVPVCEAQQCPVIHVKTNVQVIGDSEEATYGNVVQFSCKSHTEMLSGSREMYCDENGEWRGQAPECKEITCTVPKIENGSVPVNKPEYREGEVLHFRCDDKYKPNEDRPARCTKRVNRAEWIPTPACELITCKLTLPPPEGTRYEPPSRNIFKPGDTVEVICGNKHGISNRWDTSAVTTCNEDGDWTFAQVCQEVVCSNRRPQHVYDWYVPWRERITMDQTVRYSCDTGYKNRDGVTSATCTRDGWNPNPLCQEITCAVPRIRNGFVSVNIPEYRKGEVLQFRCDEKYKRTEDRPSKCNIQRNRAEWIPTPACEQVECSNQKPQHVDDWSVRLGQQITMDETVRYSCVTGYENTDGVTLATCTRDGWNPNTLCQEIQCNKLHIYNAQITNNEKETYSYNDTVDYECRNDTKSVFRVTCEQGGWTGIRNCSECEEPVVTDGFAVIPISDTLYYACNKGYKPFTKGWWAEAECNDGTWLGLGRCIVNTMCGEIPVIPNGKVTGGENPQIACNEGYSAQVNHLTCSEGKWLSNGLSPETICTLTAVPCNPPSKVDNAVVKASYQKEYLSGSEVTYQCRDKYTISEGADTIQCNNGRWDETHIMCTPSNPQ